MSEKEDRLQQEHMTQPSPLKAQDKNPGVAGAALSWAEFPPHTHAQWQQAAEMSLRGASWSSLRSATIEGLPLQPLYCAEDADGLGQRKTLPGASPFLRGVRPLGYGQQPWFIGTAIDAPWGPAWNTAAREAIAGGATALVCSFPDPPSEGLITARDVSQALQDIDLSQLTFVLAGGRNTLPGAALLCTAIQQSGYALADMRGTLGADPLGALIRYGQLSRPLSDGFDELAELARWCGDHAPFLHAVTILGSCYHDGGGHAVQELGFALATGAEYLRALMDRGLNADQAACSVTISFSVGTRFFVEVAKLRAARLLWDHLTSAFGCNETARRLSLYGRSSRWAQSRLDPWVNILRGTIEACAAAVGGLEIFIVDPYDRLLGATDQASRRLARNTQIILRDESFFTQVVDPAGGAWSIEVLTDQLARAAWRLFQQVEERGGMSQALLQGFPQQEIAQVARQRRAAVARQQEIYIGANTYANPAERPPSRDQADGDPGTGSDSRPISPPQEAASPLAPLTTEPAPTLSQVLDAAAAGAHLVDLYRILAADQPAVTVTAPALDLQRPTRSFEELRHAATAQLTRTGHRPQAFLINLATPEASAMLRSRTQFAQAFFELGGFEVLGGEGYPALDAALSAARSTAARIYLLCATDAAYPIVVPALAQALSSDDKTSSPAPDPRSHLIVVAGRPPADENASWAALVEEFIFLDADRVAVLSRLQQALEVR